MNVSYSKIEVIKILKDINEFVVSMDQINKIHHDHTEEEWGDALLDYLHENKVSERLSQIRSILSKPFSNEVGEDDMDELEREMESVNYWSYKAYLETRDK